MSNKCNILLIDVIGHDVVLRFICRTHTIPLANKVYLFVNDDKMLTLTPSREVYSTDIPFGILGMLYFF